MNTMNTNQFGILYIVATPIGNLQDITLRAIEILKSVDYIAAEDTRHSKPLLQHYLIKTPTISLHEHNEEERTVQLLKRLVQGESIALISDAGTPLISDPGYILVEKARAEGIRVVPIPGACAAVAALSASGLSTDRFVFEGFLPQKSSLRKQILEQMLQEKRTAILYEAPHRMLDLLQDIQTILGANRQIVIARELTKLFETIYSGTVAEALLWACHDPNQQRGEFVVLLAGVKSETSSDEQSVQVTEVLKILLESLPLKQAVELASKITKQRKNELYQLALTLKSS